MRGQNRRHNRVVSLALAAGLGLSGMAGTAAAASLEADFNGDGYDDLAAGAPSKLLGGGTNGGAVNVIYGSAKGLKAAGSQLWDQDVPGVLGDGDFHEEFGAALATGDFDGDGFADLAIGVPRETVSGSADAGVVNVLYGTRSGLSASGDQLWHQNKKGVEDRAEPADAFGRAVFAGDFDGDGRGDLAIGVPGEALGATVNVGAVNLLYGTRRGLRANGDQVWDQDSPGIDDLAEGGDTFGLALP